MATETLVLIIFGSLWLGGLVYCLLGIWAARRFRLIAAPRLREDPAALGGGVPSSIAPAMKVSLLKPLSGMEHGLEANLESFFRQDYPDYEILFAVNREDDPALEIVERCRQKYPDRNVRVVMAADSPYPNAKVYSMERMERLARGEVLVISDSDVSVTPDYLRTVVGGFANPKIGVVTCLYRGVAGPSLWSRLEALGMSTRFMTGVLVAWLLEEPSALGMQFALGPTMAIRRECLEAIGGFPAMAHYLADDFVLGKWASERGYRVMLSSYVLDHHVLGESLLATFQHQLRWARSSRNSRPLGYIGELFTHPTVLAGLLAGWGLLGLTHAMPVALAVAVVFGTLALRWWVAAEVGRSLLGDQQLRDGWWLGPLGDILGFVVWLGGFTGRTIHWRGIAYRVGRDGRFEPLEAAPVSAALAPVAQDELAPAPGEHIHGAGGQ